MTSIPAASGSSRCGDIYHRCMNTKYRASPCPSYCAGSRTRRPQLVSIYRSNERSFGPDQKARSVTRDRRRSSSDPLATRRLLLLYCKSQALRVQVRHSAPLYTKRYTHRLCLSSSLGIYPTLYIGQAWISSSIINDLDNARRILLYSWNHQSIRHPFSTTSSADA